MGPALFTTMEICPFLNGDREGMEGEKGRQEMVGGGEKGKLWSVCKVNEKSYLNKIKYKKELIPLPTPEYFTRTGDI